MNIKAEGMEPKKEARVWGFLDLGIYSSGFGDLGFKILGFRHKFIATVCWNDSLIAQR